MYVRKLIPSPLQIINCSLPEGINKWDSCIWKHIQSWNKVYNHNSLKEAKSKGDCKAWQNRGKLTVKAICSLVKCKKGFQFRDKTSELVEVMLMLVMLKAVTDEFKMLFC